MNPRLHDEFVELCALFYSGELSEEEWSLLQVHMAYCDSCRATFEEFAHASQDVIPVMAQAAAAQVPLESDEQFDAAARLFAARLEGTPSHPAKPQAKRSWTIYGAIAACGLAASTYGVWAYLHGQAGHAVLTQSATAIERPAPSAPTPVSSGTEALSRSENENIQLHRQVDELERESTQAKASLVDLQKQIEADRLQFDQATADKQSLAAQLNSAQGSVQSLHEQLTAAHTVSGQHDDQVAALTTRIHNLDAALADANTALETKDRMLALDKDFLSHDKDIRDLIGSRNLYIADIYDTTEKGKTAKPFGRIFYTQDRSLVFYGFDLDKQPTISRTVSYQVWGSGSDRDPVSLGLFYQDDGHKRWVLRCNDSKSLSRLNMVFVTVEPPGGSHKPTGKQLLRAYLQIEPNHP
ncbi:MAG: hypothetical protein PW792_04530 [Acidobacteriaceae bacterium]|nr:hypothetical protein [Acidobacteriaceae bacterium]